MGGRTKTKAERQQWWFSLSDDAKELQIAKWQERKEKRRKNRPAKVQAYNPKYPWATEGVTDSNRSAWQKVILKKNQWLSPEVFGKVS